MREMTKAVKRELNRVANAGYQEALRRELEKLAADFDRWRSGAIDPFELSERIHKFHNGADRELYKRFAMRRSADADWLTVHCLNEGLIEEKDVSAEAMAYLAPLLVLSRSSSL